MGFQLRRVIRRSLILAAVVAAGAAALIYAGRYLYKEDPLKRADALFVLGGTRLERALEAIDLYREGYAPIILLSPGREEPAEVIARGRGVRLLRDAEIVAEALAGSGIPRGALIVGPGSVDNTAAEAALLKRLTTERGWRSVIVVTSKYHSRRSGFAMRRELAGTGVEIIMRASRYDPGDPAHWWRTRSDTRQLSEEVPKLIAYRLGLGR